MKLVILVAGPTQIGKKRLLEEINRSPTAATVASSGSDESHGLAVTVKNKYFNQEVFLQMVPITQLEEAIESYEGWSEEGGRSQGDRDEDGGEKPASVPTKIIGLIVLLPSSRSLDAVDWCLFRSDFCVRMLMCREGYPPTKENEAATRQDLSDQWYAACVAHSVEYVPFRWNAESFSPRPKIECSGLLGEELAGSERVLQALWNINFANLPTRVRKEAVSTPLEESTAARKVFKENSSNTVLCLGIQAEPIVRLLERIFNSVHVEKDPANEPPSGMASGPKSACPLLLSGRRATFDVKNKYFSLCAAARLLTPFYFTSSMIDILALGPRYKMLFLFIDSMSELPQLQQGVEKLRELTDEVYLVAHMDNVPVLVKQWGEHHATELIQVLSTDDGTRFDREEGSLGLRRIKELFDVCQWDMNEATMAAKASTSGGTHSLPSASDVNEKTKRSPADNAKDVFHKLSAANPNLLVLFSVGAQPEVVYSALQASGLAQRFNGLIRREFLLGATEPAPTTETLIINTKYYNAAVKCIHVSLRSEEDVKGWVPAFLGAPVVLCAAESNSSDANHSRIRELVLSLLLQRIPEFNEENVDVADEKVTALLTLGSASSAPTATANNVELWPVPESEDRYIETIVVAEDPQRLSELVLSTVWPKSDRTRLSEGAPLAAKPTPSLTGALSPSGNSSDPAEQSLPDMRKAVKRFGCELPPAFFVHPQTLITSRFPQDATAEMISARVKLVKDFGSRLSPTERSRQAEYFATRMAEHVLEE
jgi:hypothetical protein